MDFFLQGNTVDTRPKTVLRARRRKVRGGKQDGNLEVINVGEQQQEQVTPPSECQSS